jgi:deoxyribonuclease (pyrimidine dimer)
MTRINVIPVKELMDQHLLAEIREIVRLPKNLHISLNRKSKPFSESEIPPEYVLGKGHVKFFMSKFKWLEKRYLELLDEAKNRSFTIKKTYVGIFSEVPTRFYNDWQVSEIAVERNKERIKERLDSKQGFYRYYGELNG